LPKVRPPTCLLADFITDRDPVTIIETSSKWPGLPHPPHLGFISFFRNIGLESKIFFLDLARGRRLCRQPHPSAFVDSAITRIISWFNW
jgi:hypothetical protein